MQVLNVLESICPQKFPSCAWCTNHCDDDFVVFTNKLWQYFWLDQFWVFTTQSIFRVSDKHRTSVLFILFDTCHMSLIGTFWLSVHLAPSFCSNHLSKGSSLKIHLSANNLLDLLVNAVQIFLSHFNSINISAITEEWGQRWERYLIRDSADDKNPKTPIK